MSVGVVGLGYVGLPLAVAFADAGVDVVAYDIAPSVIAGLRDGASHIEDVSDGALAAAGRCITPTGDAADLARCEAIVICVPTPLTRNREPDLRPLDGAALAIAPYVRVGDLVVLESTTYPGTTRERLVPLLEAGSGLRAGTDFAVAYSPERVDPGRTDHTLRTTPKLVGGVTPACATQAQALYASVCDTVVTLSSPDAAEMAKLLENIFRSVNIALVNEMGMLAERMGIDIWEVVDAAATKPYGFMSFEPGPGMGGHCLPVDPFYLAWRAREFDTTAEFVELAGRINQQMPHECVRRAERLLNEAGRAVRGSRVAVVGVSYKAGVGDVRESPALKIIGLLEELGAEVVYHDPYVSTIPSLGLHGLGLDEALDGADLAVILTAHPGVDHAHVAAQAPLTLDLRGVTRER